MVHVVQNPNKSDVEARGRDDGNGAHASVDDDLNVPVVELGFGQINNDGPHAGVDLRQAPYLSTTVEADFAHRGCDLERLLTLASWRRDCDGGWQAAHQRGELRLGLNCQQPIERLMEGVLIDFAIDKEALHDHDPPLP
jgi:hypothetical protein